VQYSKVGGCPWSTVECDRRRCSNLWRLLDSSKRRLYSERSFMIAVIGNVLIGFVALSLFTATVRIGR
jgi:hypothetical protein